MRKKVNEEGGKNLRTRSGNSFEVIAAELSYRCFPDQTRVRGPG